MERGIRFGDQVAGAVLAARANDGAAATPPVFTPATGPGEYQLTPPAFAPAGFTQTAHVTPFVLGSAGQFRPAPPPAPTSARYAEDFAEVQSLGELNSTTRTADETAVGRFWGAAPIWIVWNQIADQAAIGFGNGLEQNARLFALLDTTLADGAIALYDAKYAYHRWRPITAITAADQGNPNTTADPNWVPLANTANDPSYPGAHATFSQAAATVLEDFFGTDVFSVLADEPGRWHHPVVRELLAGLRRGVREPHLRRTAFPLRRRSRSDPGQPGGRFRGRPRPRGDGPRPPLDPGCSSPTHAGARA